MVEAKRGLRFYVAIGILVALLAVRCQAGEPWLPEVSAVFEGGQQLTLEVADTSEARQKGLSGRDGLPRDRGMLFVHDAEGLWGFWMKDTRFPLDLVFLDSERRVVDIHQMQPYALEVYYPAQEAQYIIEMTAGLADAWSLALGQVVEW